MSNEIEAAGAAVSAGLAASVLEGREARLAARGPCANCGAQTVGAYCHACGQPAHVHRTLGHMIEEFLHGIWHFDTKAWRTLPLVVFRPGTLTRNYVYGRRARYISPLALFLFMVFAMFFAFSVIEIPDFESPAGKTIAEARLELPARAAQQAAARTALEGAEIRLDAADVKEAEARLTSDGALLEGALREVEGARTAFTEAQERARTAQRELEELQAALDKSDANFASLKMAQNDLIQRMAAAEAAGEGARAAALRVALAKVEAAVAAMQSGEAPLAISGKGGVRIAGNDVNVNLGLNEQSARSSFLEEIKKAEEAGKISVNTGNKDWDKKIHAKLANPEFGLYKIENTAYKLSFLLVPISLPFLWLVFAWKRSVTLFDHTVFILYSLSVASLLTVVLLILGVLPFNTDALAGGLIGLGGPLHMFFHLKGAYALGWLGAAWRAIYLVIASLFCIAIFVAIIVMLGLTG